MTMQRWMLLVLIPLLLPSCAGRYQALLRDRDAEIRQLESENAELRALNEDLARLEREARDALANRPTFVEATVDDPAARVRDAIGENDLDVRMRAGRLSIGVPNSVTFDSGQSTLKTDAGRVLQNVARVVKSEYPNTRVFVEGHTDTDPIQKTKNKYRSNRHLSTERADAVAQYLIDQCGIPERQIVVVGYGPHDPVASGNSKNDKARNRRVEIVIGDRL
jgi:chemotaxis protein MotB